MTTPGTPPSRTRRLEPRPIDEHRHARRQMLQEIGEVGLVGRREQQLGRPADAKPRDVGKAGAARSAVRAGRASRRCRLAANAPRITPRSRRAAGSSASHCGSACAQSVELPAPRQITMSPCRAICRTTPAISRSLSMAMTARCPVCTDAVGQGAVVDAVDGRLAGRIERRDDDGVGIAQSSGRTRGTDRARACSDAARPRR